MTLQHWPDDDQPRNKLLTHGAGYLSNTELLAILLQTGSREHNAVELARLILGKYPKLEQLANASLTELTSISGVGPAKYAVIQAAFTLCRRQIQAVTTAETIHSTTHAMTLLRSRLANSQNEQFACIFIGLRQQVLGVEVLGHGTINRTQMHSREVAKAALRYNASIIIIGHNHPTGSAEPSRADILATHQLIKDLQPLSIKVLDHIIIGDKEYVSFLEKGLM